MLPQICSNCSTQPDTDAWANIYGYEHTAVTVEVEGFGFGSTAQVVPGDVVSVALPFSSFQVDSGTIGERAVHITSARDICVQGLVHEETVTDGFLALPVDALGNEYVVPSYGGHNGLDGDPEFTIIATQDGTSVTVTPSVDVIAGADTPNATTEPAGVPLTFALDRFESVQLRAATVSTGVVPWAEQDLTGSMIASTAPVAVLAGHGCAFVPAFTQACDYIVEQIPPVDTLGDEFLIAPLFGRVGYEYRVVAAHDGTVVDVDGTTVTTLNSGEFYSGDVTSEDTPSFVETSQPALVVQYAKGTNADFRNGDPFMALVVPSSQWDDDVQWTTPPEGTVPFTDYVAIIVGSGDTGGLRLDGAPITEAFSPIGSSGYVYATVEVTDGVHQLEHLTPGVGFAAYPFGWGNDDSYGYPSQLRLTPLAGGCTPTTTVAGDGVDNDCDGRYDEEIANGIDDDGDGLVDEDLDSAGGTPVNLRPVAYDQTRTTREDIALNIVLSGFDPNNDSLTYAVVTGPTNGSLSGTGNTRTYTPDANYVGNDSFTFTVNDGSLTSLEATVSIAVRAENDAPSVNVAPVFDGTEGAVFEHAIDASDIDSGPGCDLTYELISGPLGMTIDSETGDLFWIPDQDGDVSVTVRVTDCDGDSTDASFIISIDDVPEPPVITSRPVVEAVFNHSYYYDVEALDPDTIPPQSLVSFRLDAAPTGMSIDPATGEITWAPVLADAGSHPVEVVAFDGANLESQPQRFTVVVAGDGTPPAVLIEVEPFSIIPGEAALVRVTATDDDDAIIDVVEIDGVPVTLDGAGETLYTGVSVGAIPIHAEAVDPTGNRGMADGEIRVLAVGDDAPPMVTLTAPETDAELTYLHDVVGSVFDDNLYEWTVALQPTDGRRGFQTVLRGTDNIDGVLGQLDTTQMINGRYTLRLQGEDVNGQIASAQVPVQISGLAKIGIVAFSVVDLVFREFGIPLAAVRSYDSRDVARGDFGHGWNLDVSQGAVRSNIPVGDGIGIFGEPMGFPCLNAEEQKSHFVEVRLGGDEHYIFRPTLANLEPTSGSCGADVIFEQIGGSAGGATLHAVGNIRVRSTPVGTVGTSFIVESYLTDITTGDVFDPDAYRLELRDGREFDITKQDGIVRVQDSNGNELFVSPFGLLHSSGRSLLFERDVLGRIVRIGDETGRHTNYEYDATGNLVSFVDATGRSTRYEYRNSTYPHHLTDIVDADGRRIAAIDYAPDGRIDSLCDPEGLCTANGYDIGARQWAVAGPDGATTMQFDAEGNLLVVSDPLGNETTREFDSNGHLVTETDPLGNVTTWTRADDGQPLSKTDPDGNTTTWTYDASGRISTVRDANGHLEQRSYDAAGNLVETTFADASTATATYDSRGLMASSTDEIGRVTTFSYDSLGRRTLTEWPDATTDSWDYDERDNIVSHVDRAGNTHLWAYDLRGNSVAHLDDSGTQMNWVQDGRGNAVSETTPLGRTTARRYDLRDDEIARVSPLGNEQHMHRDLLGRLVSTVLPNGVTIGTQYEANGRETERTINGRVVTTQQYDAAGRLTLAASSTGLQTAYTYTPAGRVAREETSAGHFVDYTYDGVGNVLTETSPSGTVSYEYDNRDRRIRTTRSDGIVEDLQYDASGQIVGVTTAGLTRTYTYDAAGNVSSATDASGTTIFATALSGLTNASFANGTALSWSTNSLRQRLSASAGGSILESREYDEDRLFARRTLPTGETLEFVFDLDQRLAQQIASVGEDTTYEYADGELVVVERDSYRDDIEYDDEGRLLSVTRNSTPMLTYSYQPATGLVDSTATADSSLSYEYDAHGRRTAIVHDTNRYEIGRDADDRVVTLLYPNNVLVSTSFDAAGRITTRVAQRPDATEFMRHELSRDAAGRITLDVLTLDGVVTSQQYGYDADGRLTSWTRTIDGVLDASEAYAWDALSNRITLTRDGVTESASFDAQNQLASQGATSYTYDAAGRRVVAGATTYAYDSMDRLVTADDVTYRYDAAGELRTRTEAGSTVEVVTDYSSGQPHPLADQESSDSNNYVWLDDSPLAQTNSTSALYLIPDAHGHVRVVTDDAAATTDTFRYDPFGRTVQSGSHDIAFGYRSMRRDPSSGLYYMHARWYDPETGTFLTRDPEDGDVYDPITFAPYTYSGGDPINFWDPTGRFAVAVGGAFSGVVTAMSAAISAGKFFLSALLVAVAIVAGTEVIQNQLDDNATLLKQLEAQWAATIAGLEALRRAARCREIFFHYTEFGLGHVIFFTRRLFVTPRYGRFPTGAYATTIPPVGPSFGGWTQQALANHIGRPIHRVKEFVAMLDCKNPTFRPVPHLVSSGKPDYRVSTAFAGRTPVPGGLQTYVNIVPAAPAGPNLMPVR